MIKIYSLYDVPPKDGIEFTELSMTQQQFVDECDINLMMKKYKILDLQTSIFFDETSAGDFSNAGDYTSCMNALLEADSNFSSLPSQVRRDFNNNPAMFIDFMSRLDEDAVFDKAASYGLLSEEAIKTRLASREASLTQNVAPGSVESPDQA